MARVSAPKKNWGLKAVKMRKLGAPSDSALHAHVSIDRKVVGW